MITADISPGSEALIFLSATIPGTAARISGERNEHTAAGITSIITGSSGGEFLALIHSGKLLNFVPSQISQLQDDLLCLYGQPLPRFPDPQDISGKLEAAQRLHRQISAQNGVLWQHFRKEAAKLNLADDAALTDVLLR